MSNDESSSASTCRNQSGNFHCEIKKGDIAFLDDLLSKGIMPQFAYDRLKPVVMRRDTKVRILLNFEIVEPFIEDDLPEIPVLCQSQRILSYPLQIVDQQAGVDGLIGGNPPVNVYPPSMNKNLQYFLTAPFSTSPKTQISVFVADFEELLGKRGELNQSGLVEVVLHKPSERAPTSEFASPLTPHGLLLLEKHIDWIDDQGNRVIIAGHKIGGTPHLIRKSPKVMNMMKFIEENNFDLVLQIDFPGPKDALIAGNWPFGDGLFYLFSKPPYGDRDWVWFWDM
ncbi:MAG TPA: hypothetical protein PLB18_20805 [Acidobacteriota bacterium]|nr:hypothetical protein [Acidobacteriota bacterium]